MLLPFIETLISDSTAICRGRLRELFLLDLQTRFESSNATDWTTRIFALENIPFWYLSSEGGPPTIIPAFDFDLIFAAALARAAIYDSATLECNRFSRMRSLLLIAAWLLLRASCIARSVEAVNASHIILFHIINNQLWGETDGSYLQGVFPCAELGLHCELLSSDPMLSFRNGSTRPLPTRKRIELQYPLHAKKLDTKIVAESPFTIILSKFALHREERGSWPPITVTLYNIHTWKAISYSPYKPDILNLPTDYQIVESEESFGRFGHLFHRSFRFFDANSTTSPYATIQRTYMPHFNESELYPLRSHANLVPAAAYVASTCHDRKILDDLSRDQIVDALRKNGLRVDGLGPCRYSSSSNISYEQNPPMAQTSHPLRNKPPIRLTRGAIEKETLKLKQDVLSQYMFYLAFENTIEEGYVTEKVYDGLIAGTVPVYLGAAADLKAMFAVDAAIIYVDDFLNKGDPSSGQNRWKALAEYLISLIDDPVAYEKHRSWRNNFHSSYLSPLLRKSWPCRLCEWTHTHAKL